MKSLTKYAGERMLITIIAYSGGVLLVDLIGLKYYVAGLLLAPITFTLGYLISKHFVFKHGKG